MSDAAAADTLPQSDVHDVLRNDRRRNVIRRLAEAGPGSVRDLAEHIASIESGESPPPRNVRQSVYVSLHQTHLPKLDDLDIVVYDDDAKEVWLSDRADEVTVYLDGVPETDDDDEDWPELTLGLAAVGLVATGAGAAAAAPWVAAAVAAAALLGVVVVAGSAAFGEAALPFGDDGDDDAAGSSPTDSREGPDA